MRNGHNVFLTGEAGTGKSFVIDTFRRTEQRSIVTCAPTGIAALNVSGRTVNSLLRLKIGTFDLDYYGKGSDELNCADVLLVDEVSMVRIDMMQAISNTVARINARRARKEPYRLRDGTEVLKEDPLQVVVCGDFFQLPPVVEKDSDVLAEVYGTAFKEGYAFEAEGWEKLGFAPINLTEVVRQADPEFIAALNAARHGDPECIAWFNTHTAQEPVVDALQIVPTNKLVDKRNNSELEKLPGKAKVFNASFRRCSFDAPEREKAFKDVNLPEILRLKIGAKVMLLANGEGYVNGSTGKVARFVDGIEAERIVVELDGGGEIVVEQEEVDITKPCVVDDPTQPGKKKIEDKKVAEITQYPLKLAYAITIHKSQGQTYNSPVTIDPSAWAPGQLYVALSRCTDVAKIHLSKPLTADALVVSKSVQEFYEGIEGDKRCKLVKPGGTGQDKPVSPAAGLEADKPPRKRKARRVKEEPGPPPVKGDWYEQRLAELLAAM